jgi:hypothetical protein
MSGGSYDYKYKELENLAALLDPQPRDEKQPIRKRLGSALLEIAQQCHDVEWVDSGDYGDEYWGKIEEWLEEHNF